MNRRKLIIIFFLAFLLFAFGDFVNLFAGGSCSYTVDEGAGDGGEYLYFSFIFFTSHCSPQQSELDFSLLFQQLYEMSHAVTEL